MGTRTTDDSSLYKPADGEGDEGSAETSWADNMNENLDILGRLSNQIKAIVPEGELDMDADTLYICTTGQIASTAMWTIGASSRRNFDNRNQAFVGAPERSGHVVHDVDVSGLGLTGDKIGLGAPMNGGATKGTVLFAIWEQNDAGTWVIVATAWIEVDASLPF